MLRGLLLAPVMAVSAADAAAVEHCRSLWVGHAGVLAVAGLGERPPDHVGLEGGWCVARALAGDPFGDGRGVRYPRVAWKSGETESGGASFALELDAVPAGTSALPGQSATVRDRATLSLSLGEDAAAGLLSVRLAIAFEGLNGISAELGVPGLTAAGVVPLPVRLATAELRWLSVGVEGDGRLAERWAALFPALEPPAAADRVRMAAALRSLPADAMDGASREAALALMDDWPDLRGRARIRLDAPEGFRPLALAGLGIAPDPGRWLGAALAGARLEVRYGR